MLKAMQLHLLAMGKFLAWVKTIIYQVYSPVWFQSGGALIL